MAKLKQEVRDWGWYLLEQFAVLFMPKPSVQVEGSDELQPCPTCWWYRGVALGAVLASTFITGYLYLIG